MRFLKNPRVYIYLVVSLAAVWLLKLDEAQRLAKKSAVEQLQHRPQVVKESELRSRSSRPKVILLTIDGTSEQAEELHRTYDADYDVIILKGTDDMKEYFKVDSLPALLFLDADGKRIGSK